MKENKLIIQEKEHGNIKSSFDYFMKLNIDKKVKILDIGANYGSLIFNINKEGYNKIFGIDINGNSIKKGKEVYKEISQKLKVYDGKRIPFKDNSFDVILMFDVIEHIPNIKEFLEKEVSRVLKRGGLFIFQTPNKPMNILWVYIDNHSFKVKWWEEHCSLQTYWSLKKLLKKSKFGKIKIEKYNILTEHNKNKVKKKAGLIGIMLLYFVSFLPIYVYTNFWGSAINEK